MGTFARAVGRFGVLASLLVACHTKDSKAPAANAASTRQAQDRVVTEVAVYEPDVTDLYPYSLDDLPREIEAKGRVKCPKVPMVSYRGETIRYHKPVRIYVDFRDKLREFERVVAETAVEFYGRKPRRIKHLGTYNCRRIRLWPTTLSEHGLGNAIDIEGFDFEWISKRTAKKLGIENRLRRGFHIRVERHWNRTKGVDGVHSEFLRALARKLADREDLFRVMLGPAEPGHHNHFHFDAAPWRMVNIFDEDSVEDSVDEDSVDEARGAQIP